MSFPELKYNLNYIGGIAEYQKRAIYTLNLKENSFSVDGIFKSRKFSYNDIIEVKYGEIEELKKQLDPVNVLLFGRMALLVLRGLLEKRDINYFIRYYLMEQQAGLDMGYKLLLKFFLKLKLILYSLLL